MTLFCQRAQQADGKNYSPRTFHAALLALAFLSQPAFVAGQEGRKGDPAAPEAAEPSADWIIEQGVHLAKTRCYSCHGSKFNGSPDLNVLDPASLVEHGYLDVDDAGESYLWQRVADGEMPPPDSAAKPLDDGEKRVFLRWLELGAPTPITRERPHVGPEMVLEAIRRDLLAAGHDAPFRRYFTIWRTHNNWRGTDEQSLALYRAALSKALNSLSWEPEIVLPKLIDEHQTVFAIDLRDLGWTAALWSKITHGYPYALRYDDPRTPALRDLDREVFRSSGASLCYVRADWFIHTGLPPNHVPV